jgi:type II secretion system protein J
LTEDGPTMPDQRGFTVLELLVSISILALLMVFLFGAVRVGTRSQRAVSDVVDRTEQITAVHRLLRAQLAVALPIGAETSRDRAISFEGRRDSVDFVAPPTEALTTMALQRLSIGIDEDRTRRRDLVARWQPYVGGDRRVIGEPRVSVLLDGIASAEFAYYGRATAIEQPAWQDSWYRADALPELVRLSLRFQDGSLMPALVVALRVSPG